MIDSEHGGHLEKIAGIMEEWKGAIATELGLTNVEITAAIRLIILLRNSLASVFMNSACVHSCVHVQINSVYIYQCIRKAVLQLWMEKNGDKATYRNLIGVFVKAEKNSYAKAVCEILGSHPGYQSYIN